MTETLAPGRRDCNADRINVGEADRDAFYRERDRRTEEYVGGVVEAERPVCIGLDRAAAATPAGQLILLAMANQLARVHRRIIFAIEQPDEPRVVRVPFAATTLGATLLTTCRRIDPFGCFRVQARRDASACVAVGIGETTDAGYDGYVGADRALAFLDRVPCPLRGEYAGSLRGGALASCLGAAAVFRATLGLEVVPRRLSAWNLMENERALPGPGDLAAVDVGRVLMVGAGAVGAALAYWLFVMGVGGTWIVVDNDLVELHNANRGLLFTAADAGWPDGRRGGVAAYKSQIVSPYVKGEPVTAWYHEAEETKLPFDVVLGLANQYDVRTRIAHRNAAIVLHATTGRSWLSQLHRHVAGLDDCIRCRTRDVQESQMVCSTAPVPARGGEVGGDAGMTDGRLARDAALPFLSAASGLLLATALQRLQAGQLADDPRNDWRLDFASGHRMSGGGRRRCADDCSVRWSQKARRAANAGTRWAHLDGAAGGA